MCGCIRHPRLHKCSLWDPRSRPWSIDVTGYLSGMVRERVETEREKGPELRGVPPYQHVWSVLKDSNLFLDRRGLPGTSAGRVRRYNLAKCALSRISNNEAASSQKCRFRRPGNDGKP